MVSVSVLVVLGEFAVETHGMPMKCRALYDPLFFLLKRTTYIHFRNQAGKPFVPPFFLDSSWAVFASCCIQVGTREAKHVISSLQPGNSENGFLPRVRVKTWGDAQMHWHGVNDDPDGEDILPYIKEPDRPAKLPHVDWATPKIVKDVQFLANKCCTKEEQEWKRRRTDAEEPLENEEISSSSESSDDEPLVHLQNQPHSAARVRVRRTFARVFCL
eukprot:g14815.t1